jgi:hypothetical protein
MDREARIRQRAYEIWESESWRGNIALDHWLRAKREIDAADAAAMSGDKPSEPADEADKVAPGTHVPYPYADRR